MRTRRAGRRYHLRVLIRELHRASEHYSPYLGVDSLPEEPPIPIPISVVNSTGSESRYSLQPVNSEYSSLPPFDIPPNDPRRAVYLCKRRNILRTEYALDLPVPRVVANAEILPASGAPEIIDLVTDEE
ncbi:hypothetical protein KM043_000398 [Ampulex compressa]|nr:hypothetical protein KM043_000398 [Ampulex compressa]